MMNDNSLSIFNIQKSVRALLVLCMCLAVCFPYTVSAFFSEIEASNGNAFDASSLGIAVTITDQTEDSRSLTILADHEENVEYQVTQTPATGLFCADVQVAITQDGAEIYDGSLTLFTQSTSSALLSGESDVFEYAFSVVDDNASYTGNCTITFTYKANQIGYMHGQAFFDTEVDAFMLNGSDFGTTPAVPTGVVLNEVLANPEGDDDQLGLQGEWIELYNNGTMPVDLTGWYIKDLAGHTIMVTPSTTMDNQTIIGAKGSGSQWVVLYMSGEILNNTGDTVTLYNSSNVAVDSYAFGDHGTDADSDSNHTGGNGNGNPTGHETPGNEGKSDARIPDGTGVWIDPIPTPGGYNVLEEEVETVQTQTQGNSFVFTSELSQTETIAPTDGVPLEGVESEDEKGSQKIEEGPVAPEINEEETKEEIQEEQKKEPKEEPIQQTEPEKIQPEEPSMEAIEPSPTEIE